ncbi:uncharacterized protein LOC111014496 [Momordica charantia]|uniref:Uncharacterized protein LOC111014496 n=1 Tax=Momordica charantia TaxID=3673 RepID=A0A6J1CTS2_MOMCH|nr:uncharacterized protein LOC111014496 [Momordica charantia]
MKSHVEEVILQGLGMPEEVLLYLPDSELHLKISLGMSFSATITENASQSNTSKNGGTKLSDMITGTHS